jgi:hypothetical protein
VKNKVPINLLRLRTSVRTFRAILDDTLMFLEVFAEANKPAQPTADDWAGILLQRVKLTLLDQQNPASLAAIEDAISYLLGEVESG